MKNYKRRGAIIGGILGIIFVFLDVIIFLTPSLNISESFKFLLTPFFLPLNIIMMFLLVSPLASIGYPFACHMKNVVSLNNCLLPTVFGYIIFIIFLSLFGALVGSMIKRKGNEE